MSAELLAAYRSTRYTVTDDAGALVAAARVDAPSPSVDAVLDAHGARSGVFVTAWNPRSDRLDDAVNDAAHVRLVDDLRARGLLWLPHAGVGADPAWTEHGAFVLDLAEADAVALAEAYGQNAVVIVEHGEPARLVVTSLMPG